MAKCARWIAVLLIGALAAAACSGNGSSAPARPTEAVRHWSYPDLFSMEYQLLDLIDPAGEHPELLDAVGIELWNELEDAVAAHGDLTGTDADDERDRLYEARVAALEALVTHLYASDITDDVLATEYEAHSDTIRENELYEFADEVPVAVEEIDERMQLEGCDGVRHSYNYWVGHTNFDEFAGSAEILARYALDQAALAGCEWAIEEITLEML